MLKVLIVDDDKLTRKGLIASMPWEDFSMAVVGEAANGVEALEFLACNEVDLVLTDLEMPLMSGIEFIRKASAEYPRLYFVVLTIHIDFEYIQEALRLGAIDYIAKVQLDRENFSALLKRINQRISKTVQEISSQANSWDQKLCHQETLSVLLALEDDIDAKAFFDEETEGVLYTGHGIWFILDKSQDEALIQTCSSDAWMILDLTGVFGMRYEDIVQKVLQYRKNGVFYDYSPGCKRRSYAVSHLGQEADILSDEAFQRLKDNWLQMNWVRDAAVFDRIKLDLKEAKLTTAKLLHIVVAIENAWNHAYGLTLNRTISAPPSFHSWQEIEDWLMEVYDNTNSFSSGLRFSAEVTQGIIEAKRIIESEYASRIHSDGIAKRVNMSRSYFSQCFREIVGQSFSEYLRSVRIKKAKELLIQTNYSIQQVAEMTGYYDEKYFSRIFKKSVGKLPSELRKNHRKQSEG